jgi:hypothetical protein
MEIQSYCIKVVELWILVCSMNIFLQVQPTGAATPQQILALEELYNSTNGPSWINSTNWLEGDPCSNSWFGINCSETGAIIGM